MCYLLSYIIYWELYKLWSTVPSHLQLMQNDRQKGSILPVLISNRCTPVHTKKEMVKQKIHMYMKTLSFVATDHSKMNYAQMGET